MKGIPHNDLMSLEDIARELGTTRATVEKLLYRGLKKILKQRQALERLKMLLAAKEKAARGGFHLS